MLEAEAEREPFVVAPVAVRRLPMDSESQSCCCQNGGVSPPTDTAAPPSELPSSVSTRDAAHRLGVAVPTVQRWMDQGVLRGWKTAGGHRRIELASLDSFVRRQLEGLGQRRPAGLDVLLVDDNPLDREILSDLLHGEDASIALRTARDGFEALTEVARQPPAVVVTDLRMPFMDGVQLLRHLLVDSPQLRGKVLVTSIGSGRELNGLGELRAHVEFAKKPISAAALRAFLERVAGSPSRARAAKPRR
jgi:excisionase family DNA binding protein